MEWKHNADVHYLFHYLKRKKTVNTSGDYNIYDVLMLKFIVCLV